MRKLRVAWVGIVLLAACQSVPSSMQTINLDKIEVIEAEDGAHEIANHGSGYSIRFPSEFFIYGSKKYVSTIRPPEPGKSFIYEDKATTKDSTVAILSPSSCDAAVTGARDTAPIPDTGGNTIWGDAGRTEIGRFDDDFPNALCNVPSNPDFDSRSGEVIPGDPRGAYVLCSEKDDKRVLICISQQTDNPDLARQIFETFKWTE